MHIIFSEIHVWYILDKFLFPLESCTNNCMYIITIHIDYSVNLQYLQNVSNKYILIRELSCMPIARNKSIISKNIMRT